MARIHLQQVHGTKVTYERLEYLVKVDDNKELLYRMLMEQEYVAFHIKKETYWTVPYEKTELKTGIQDYSH